MSEMTDNSYFGGRCAPALAEDDAMGMTWWNGMSQEERHEVLRQADALIQDASVAQAWRLWKANRITMTPPNPQNKRRL
jgi:predicted Fe-S protein YdhL (DUF1289 family)